MQNVTLCLLVRGDEILLAMKKRGFGVGKWNGVGGKVQEGETIGEAAIRELGEEISVIAETTDLEKVGKIDFHFNEHADWAQQMHIFLIRKWTGTPTESEEMAPKWHKRNAMPYSEMWAGDGRWFPKVLDGKKIEGEIHFRGDGDEIDRVEIKESVSQ